MVFFQQKKVMMVYHIADFTLPEVDSNPKKIRPAELSQLTPVSVSCMKNFIWQALLRQVLK